MSAIKFYGITKREKQLDGLRSISRAEIQIPESRVLVQRVLCRHCGENAKKIQEYIKLVNS